MLADFFWPIITLRERQFWADCGLAKPSGVGQKLPLTTGRYRLDVAWILKAAV